jgi:hypothetical protein
MQPRTHAVRLGLAAAFTALLSGTIVGVASSGCDNTPGVIANCDYPLLGRKDHNGQLDTCCERDPCPGHCLDEPCPDGSTPDGGYDASIEAGATSSCAGECVPLPPFGWQGPGLLWLGPDGTEMACPTQAPVVAYQGHADLVLSPPASCSACSCSPPSGACSLPAQITAGSAPCAGASTFTTTFDPPDGWDGTCTNANAVPAGVMCGNTPCVRSLTVGPLAIREESCTPSAATLGDAVPPVWMTAAVACLGNAYPLGGCAAPGVTCAVPPPSGFLACIFQSGDNACPAPYVDKHVVYASFDDERGCAPCTCGATAGSACSATIEVFRDGACSASQELLSAPLSSDGLSCFDLLPPGPALGSKTVTGLAYQPGACAPGGGEPTGVVEPSGPGTFCCLVS